MSRKDENTKQVKILHSKVKELLLEKKSMEDIIDGLKKDGIESYYAKMIIENIDDDKDQKKSFRNSLIMGGFYLGGGLLLNYMSYKFALAANSFYFLLFGGIIVLGIITIVRGFILYK